MEDRVAHFAREELVSVQVEVTGAALDPVLVPSLFAPVLAARTVGALHESLLASLRTLAHLDSFKRCTVTVLPGAKSQSAEVEFALRPVQWWRLILSSIADREGGSVCFGSVFRSLRKRADTTKTVVRFRPNTRTWGFSLVHTDPMFKPRRWTSALEARCSNTLIDYNHLSHEWAQALTISKYDKSVEFRLSRDSRVNYPMIDRCSEALLASSLLSSEKYALGVAVRADTRNRTLRPTSGHLLEAKSEFATVQGTTLNSGKATAQVLLPLHYKGVVAELCGTWQWAVACSQGKRWINDRLVGGFAKGFRAFGDRVQPAKTGHFAVGDHLGTNHILSLEGKLHFHDFPLLRHLGFSPFLYANVLSPAESARSLLSRGSVRGSCGFGVDWATAYGRLEFAYAAKVVSRCGDVPARFQVLFYD